MLGQSFAWRAGDRAEPEIDEISISSRETKRCLDVEEARFTLACLRRRLADVGIALLNRPFVVRTFTASRQLSARVAFTTVDRRSENALFTGLVRRAAVRTASLARSVPRG